MWNSQESGKSLKILKFFLKKFCISEKGRIFALAFGNEASRQGQRLVKKANQERVHWKIYIDEEVQEL